MKVHQIISENQKIDEAPVGRFKRAGQAIGRYFGSDIASGQEDVSDEANNLKKQLSRWMGTSGIKKGQLTFNDLETFLNRVGYGGLAADELEKAKSQKTLGQKVKGAVGQAAGKAAGAVGSAAKAVVAGDKDKAQAQQQSTQTQQPKADTEPKQKQPAANKADTDSYERFKGEIRQVQNPNPSATPLPNNIAKGIEPLIAKLAKGDKESGSLAAKKILSIAGKNYDVSKLASQWTASSKAGERFLTQSVFISISKMLQEYGLYWSDLKIKIRLDESVSGGVYIRPIKESKIVYRQASQELITEQESEVLDNKVIDRILLAVVQKASRQGGGEFQKGKFTSNASKVTNKVDGILKSLSPEEKSQLAAALSGSTQLSAPETNKKTAKQTNRFNRKVQSKNRRR